MKCGIFPTRLHVCLLHTVYNVTVATMFLISRYLPFSVYCRHLLGSPPKKTYNSHPQTAAKLHALSLFFGRDIELYVQIHQGNFLLMDNKHGKLFVIKQSKGAYLCIKYTKIRLAARLRLEPLGENVRCPDLAAMRAYL